MAAGNRVVEEGDTTKGKRDVCHWWEYHFTLRFCKETLGRNLTWTKYIDVLPLVEYHFTLHFCKETLGRNLTSTKYNKIILQVSFVGMSYAYTHFLRIFSRHCSQFNISFALAPTLQSFSFVKNSSSILYSLSSLFVPIKLVSAPSTMSLGCRRDAWVVRLTIAVYAKQNYSKN